MKYGHLFPFTLLFHSSFVVQFLYLSSFSVKCSSLSVSLSFTLCPHIICFVIALKCFHIGTSLKREQSKQYLFIFSQSKKKSNRFTYMLCELSSLFCDIRDSNVFSTCDQLPFECLFLFLYLFFSSYHHRFKSTIIIFRLLCSIAFALHGIRFSFSSFFSSLPTFLFLSIHLPFHTSVFPFVSVLSSSTKLYQCFSSVIIFF